MTRNLPQPNPKGNPSLTKRIPQPYRLFPFPSPASPPYSLGYALVLRL